MTNMVDPWKTAFDSPSKSPNASVKNGERANPHFSVSVGLTGPKVCFIKHLVSKPLFSVFARIWTGPEKDESSGEWRQWGIEQSTILSRRLVSEAGFDLIDVSSGGNWAAQKIKLGPSYQARSNLSSSFTLCNHF